MVDKTKLGIEIFDETFGGVYRGRTTFCYGRKDSGKSIIASCFLHQALLDGDRSLLLTDWLAKDALIVAESVGVPLTHMVRTGNLTILEYVSFVPGMDMCEDSPLPPTAFIELQKFITSRSIRRVVFDTALPWIAIHPVERMPRHVFSFVHALERLNVTTLLTLPWPVSTPAFMLKNRLEDVCPVVLVTQRAGHTGESFFKVAKYLGDNPNSTPPIAFKMNAGRSAIQVAADSEFFAIPSSDRDVQEVSKITVGLPGVDSQLELKAPLSTRKRASQLATEPETQPKNAPNERDAPISFSSVIDF